MRNSYESIPEFDVELAKDTLKSEHLNEGVNPIVVCVGSPAQFEKYPGAEEEALKLESSTHQNCYVNFQGKPDALAQEKFQNAGLDTYVISPIDGLNKFSKNFFNCTGLLVAGQDKETGKNISFLSHQYPGYILNKQTFSHRPISKQEHFLDDLRQRLREMKERCEDGTIDAGIFGGDYNGENEYRCKEYVETIGLLDREVHEILGFEPVALTGPKIIDKEVSRRISDVGAFLEDVFYENEYRRFYVVRKKVEEKGVTGSFRPGDIKEQEKKW